jgi:UDP-N-acetylglucosamine acyltransferase
VVVEGPVIVGARTRVLAHATLLGSTTIGADNEIHMGAVIGNTPQDRGYAGGESGVRIGDRNIFREHVQVHRASSPGGATEIGDDNFFMATSHVAHDCRVGNHVTLANGAVLGGHATVEDRVFLSGNSAVHQHVRVGTLAFLRGVSAADRDVPPYCIVDAINVVRALNRVGLRRAGVPAAGIDALRRAFRILFARRRNLALAMEEVGAGPVTAEVQRLLDFIRSSTRGICSGPHGR